MASFTVSPNSSILLLRLQPSSPSQISPVLPSYQKQFSCRRSRGSVVVPRGGAPGASTYVFAFVFPLSLLAVTIFTAIIISDKLDRDFYEEQEVNQSMLEAENEDEDVPPTFEEPSTQQRTRNRPKREAEISGRYLKVFNSRGGKATAQHSPSNVKSFMNQVKKIRPPKFYITRPPDSILLV